jgi:hypothetical protein
MKNLFKKAGILVLVLLMFGVPAILAQNSDVSYITIKGIIKDSETKSGVVFATVSILETHIGTVTNSDGEFTIKIQKSLSAKKLEFTHIGYHNKIIPISKLKPEENIVLLEPTPVSLDEVTVRPANAKDLVWNAMKMVAKNYSLIPLNFTAFYRETIKKRRDYISISEAVVDIYKGSYINEYDDDKAKIYKGRKSANVKPSDTLAVRLQGGPYISLLLDIVKNPYVLISEDFIGDYEFELTNILSIANKLNYVVSFKPRVVNSDFPLYEGKYYINVQSLAFTSAEFSLDIEDREKASKFFVKKKPIGLKLVPVRTNYIIKYKENNGKYYYNYARSEVKFKCKWKKKFFNTNYTIMSEMATTDWNIEKADKFNRKEVLKKNNVFAEELTAFMDDDFWGEYNYIEPDESLESAIQKYNRKIKKQNK